MAGPLANLRVLELGGIGPGPHAAMLLADLGADVVRVERPSGGLRMLPPGVPDWFLRGVRIVSADLKTPEGKATLDSLLAVTDVVIEGYRPGVAERLGIGPDDVAAVNPGAIYARMTGWGQDGPLAQRAGHDINYIGLTGGLNAFRVEGSRPVPPINMFGDFGGGSLYLVMGILAALFERQSSGRGQTVDGAIVDGTASLLQMVWNLRSAGLWSDTPAVNMLDTGAPFYDTYECADGEWIAVGALERQFFSEPVRVLGEATPGFSEQLPDQHDVPRWPEMRALFERTFATRSRDEWAKLFDGVDACVAPVLSAGEAPMHPHVAARGTLVELDGVVQPAPAPRFSRTPSAIGAPPRKPGEDTRETLLDWGFAADELDKLFADGVVAQPDDPERGVYGEARS